MKKLFKVMADWTQFKANLKTQHSFFKKVQGEYINTQFTQKTQIVDQIEYLNRVILEGQKRDIIMTQIRQIVVNSQLGHNITPMMEDACEIVHYAILNNQPVFVRHIKTIYPEIDLSDIEILNEKQYQQDQEQPNKELQQDIFVETYDKNNYNQNEHYERQRQKWTKRKQNQ